MKTRKRRTVKGRSWTAVISFDRKKSSSHIRDVSSKTVFSNAVLCAQFLRDNVNVPILKDISPDDIEDVSERYRPYLGIEFEPDTVKRIRIHVNGSEVENESLFLISLIEHKSLVDYDVSMQLLKYMMCIWMEYRKEMESNQEVDRIIRDSPGSVIDVIASVIEGLCIKIGATEEETRQCVKKVKERKMGYLFESMEKWIYRKSAGIHRKLLRN